MKRATEKLKGIFNLTPNNAERDSQQSSTTIPRIVDAAPDTLPISTGESAVRPILDVVEPTGRLVSQPSMSVTTRGGIGVGAIVGIGGRGGDIVTNITNICEYHLSSNPRLDSLPMLHAFLDGTDDSDSEDASLSALSAYLPLNQCHRVHKAFGFPTSCQTRRV